MSKKATQPIAEVPAITDAMMVEAFSNRAGHSEGNAAFARFLKKHNTEKGSEAAIALGLRWKVLAKPFVMERTAKVEAKFKAGLMHCAFLNHAESMGVISLTDKGRALREANKTAEKAAKAAAKS